MSCVYGVNTLHCTQRACNQLAHSSDVLYLENMIGSHGRTYHIGFPGMAIRQLFIFPGRDDSGGGRGGGGVGKGVIPTDFEVCCSLRLLSLSVS